MAIAAGPPDAYNGAWLIFFLQGVGQLYPWNVFISAESYFSKRFCSTRYVDSFENFFGLGYNAAAIMGLLLALRYQSNLSHRVQIVGGLCVAFAVFFTSTILVYNVSISGNALFGTMMLLVCISAVAVAFVQSGLFGMAATFPASCTQAMMAGQGLAGLVVALTSLLTTLSGPAAELPADCPSTLAFEPRLEEPILLTALDRCAAYTVDRSTAAYFGVAAATLALCVVAYLVLERLPYSQYCQSAAHDDTAVVPSKHAGDYDLVSPLNRDSCYADYETEADTDEVAYSSSGSNFAKWYSPSPHVRAAFSSVRPLAYSVCAVFTVTLAIFPSTTAKIRSQSACDPRAVRFRHDLFTPLTFVIFNAADLGGRSLSGLRYSWLQLRADSLPLATAARCSFIPLLLLCRVHGSRFTAALRSDAFPVLLILLFGLSNGYLSSRCMMAGPARAAGPLKETAGTVMVLFLSLGLLLGSLLSFVVLAISTGSAQ